MGVQGEVLKIFLRRLFGCSSYVKLLNLKMDLSLYVVTIIMQFY